MELRYLEAEPGDVVLPPYPDGDEDEVSTLFRFDEETREVVIALDDGVMDFIAIHIDQVDDFIFALKTIKENHV